MQFGRRLRSPGRRSLDSEVGQNGQSRKGKGHSRKSRRLRLQGYRDEGCNSFCVSPNRAAVANYSWAGNPSTGSCAAGNWNRVPFLIQTEVISAAWVWKRKTVCGLTSICPLGATLLPCGSPLLVRYSVTTGTSLLLPSRRGKRRVVISSAIFASAMKWPAGFAETTRPSTGVPTGIASAPPAKTTAATVPWKWSFAFAVFEVSESVMRTSMEVLAAMVIVLSTATPGGATAAG